MSTPGKRSLGGSASLRQKRNLTVSFFTHSFKVPSKGRSSLCCRGNACRLCCNGGATSHDDSPPDFILSGINRGANIGNETIFSGTVGAAMTGVLLGFRAIALSQYFNNRHNIHWDTAEHASEIVLKYLIQGRWDYGTCFNVNLPDVEPDSIKDIAITRQGEGNLNNIGVIVREDLRAIPYAWLNLGKK